MSSVIGPFPPNPHTHSNSLQGNSKNTTSKTTAAAQQAVSSTPKPQETDEREFYINLVMKEKGVAKDVAAVEYDFWN